ncbi:MAG TPA: PilZ domain-containing protein [Gammaproteobacteria bacterium]|nr:PilZ domain-containing protein [Gammaproteobacteria bacterium]
MMDAVDIDKLTEQRWSQRRPIVLSIDVLDHGSLVTTCNSRDVGLGGVFLESEANRLVEDQDVELCFSLGENITTKHKLQAKVVHVHSRGGAGLKFKNFDTNSFCALQEIMKYSSPVFA